MTKDDEFKEGMLVTHKINNRTGVLTGDTLGFDTFFGRVEVKLGKGTVWWTINLIDPASPAAVAKERLKGRL